MIRRPPRSTLDRSSAASDVYKRQAGEDVAGGIVDDAGGRAVGDEKTRSRVVAEAVGAVSYTHLRAHETVLDLVCRLLLEKKKNTDETSDRSETYSLEAYKSGDQHQTPHT